MSIKKNFIYNALLGLTNILVPIVTFPYVARVLGPDGIGITSFAISLSVTFIVLGSLGIPIYGIREIAKAKGNDQKLSKTFSELVSIHFIWSLIVILLFALWLFFSNTYTDETAIKYLSFLHILSSVGLINWFYQGIEKYKFISILNLISKILTIGLLFVLIKQPEDYWLYYFIIVLSNALSAIISVVYSVKHVKFTIVGLNFRKHLKPILILFSTQLAISIYVNMDVIMLKYFSVVAQVGYYAAAIKIVKILLVGITSLGVVLIPKIATYIQEKKSEEVKSLIEKSINFVVLLSFPTIAMVVLTSKNLIDLFAGNAFMEAAILVKLLVPLILIIGLTNIFALQILVPSNKEKDYMKAVLVALVINIVLNSMLIPILQSKGAVIATVVTELTGLILTFYYSRKLVRFSLNLKVILKYLLISLLFVPLSFLISMVFKQDVMFLITFLTSAIMLYGLVLLFLKDAFFMDHILKPLRNGTRNLLKL